MHIQWKLKFHQVRLSSLKREVKSKKKKKKPLGGRRTEEAKQKERKGRCVSARGVWETGHGELYGAEVALGGAGGGGDCTAHDTETSERKCGTNKISVVQWKQRGERSRCCFLWLCTTKAYWLNSFQASPPTMLPNMLITRPFCFLFAL